jgi:drug/metabolite transporter (DMT)-like permease
MTRATLSGAIAILLWTTLAALSRLAAEIPPLQLTAMAFGVSAMLGLLWLALVNRLSDLRQGVIAWAHGVGGLFGYHALFFLALAWAPPIEANLLNYLWPLLIVLLSAPVLGMRLRSGHLAGVVLGLSGCVLAVGAGARFPAAALPGFVAAIGCALVWALYSVTSRRMASVPTTAVVGFCAVSALLGLVVHLAFERTVMPGPVALGAIILLGAGPVGAAFFLWDVGMKHGDPRLLGTLSYATPVASTLLLVLMGEGEMTLRLALAASLVAAGGLIAARAGR